MTWFLSIPWPAPRYCETRFLSASEVKKSATHSWCGRSILKSHVAETGFHGISMDFMGFLLDFYGISIGFLWDFYWISMGFLWDFYGISIGFLWDFYGISMGFMGFLRVLVGFLWLVVRFLRFFWTDLLKFPVRSVEVNQVVIWEMVVHACPIFVLEKSWNCHGCRGFDIDSFITQF